MNRSDASRVIAAVALVAFGWFIGGLDGLFGALVIVALTLRLPRAVLGLVVASPLVMALVTLLESDTERARAASFPLRRPWAHRLGIWTVVLWVAAVWLLWRSVERPPAGKMPERDRVEVAADGDERPPPIGLLVAMVVAAVVAASILID